MSLLVAFLVVQFLAIIAIPFVPVTWKGIIVYMAILLNALIAGYYAFQTLSGEAFEFIINGGAISGPIRIKIDALSGWFILIINFVFLTGGFYGLFYMKAYRAQKNNLSFSAIAFVLLNASLLSLCVIQNGFAFLIVWEIMALSAFFSVIFEHEDYLTLKAGLNYLIQSHVSILFLMLGFIWVAIKTGSFDFVAITIFTAENQESIGLMLFLFFFIGFAIKAGFVPFHTWLPYAHPVAPAHISGIMSGVLIKIGIFGILRILTLIQVNYFVVGLIILGFSILSGLYGVMLAIMQHNLKKLLAYHSIENIGIIGIGIGIGSIGLGIGNNLLATLGFAGALLHTLNHALFKSLLFYTSGNIYQATHTLQIDHLGGLIKKMPQTTFLFLISSLAISGIPPFNGFISEFIIYSGFYYWLPNAAFGQQLVIIFSVLALVLIGGFAILCFTKAFGVVFLGSARHPFSHPIKEVSFLQLTPLYLISLLVVIIGLFPQFFLQMMNQSLSLLVPNAFDSNLLIQDKMNSLIQPLTRSLWIFVLVVIFVYLLRKLVLKKHRIETAQTWACGYVAPNAKQQYTASSFVRSYSKLFKPILSFIKKENDVQGIFPTLGMYETHIYDRIEKYLIDVPIKGYKSLLGRFVFLQNGKLQFYIVYGIIFIIAVLGIPLFYELIISFFEFIKQI